jgi:hypothetical protein
VVKNEITGDRSVSETNEAVCKCIENFLSWYLPKRKHYTNTDTASLVQCIKSDCDKCEDREECDLFSFKNQIEKIPELINKFKEYQKCPISM